MDGVDSAVLTLDLCFVLPHHSASLSLASRVMKLVGGAPGTYGSSKSHFRAFATFDQLKNDGYTNLGDVIN